jgi:pantoate--beta-alanine ligase
MIIFQGAANLSVYLQIKPHKLVGFVPTMGALHEGHLSLLHVAKQQTQLVVSSIFVNPTQFNDPADFKKYPITLEADLEILERNGCDVVFLPSVDEMYPNGIHLEKKYELGSLEHILEGEYRPGHFQGVCQVVDRLLEIVNPDKLFLGQKDYQQCMVIKRLISLRGHKTTIVNAPTKRGPGGLALSSRNALLSDEEKLKAENLYKALLAIVENLKTTSFFELEKDAAQFLMVNGFSKVDYIKVANADNLEILDHCKTKTPLIVLAAAYMGNVRLIDNLLLNS